jgi:uncharacterized repeat protein (TIGR03803 family)
MTRIESCLRPCVNFMNRFLLIIGICLCGILVAFAPVAAGQMKEKVLYSFGGNSSGALSSLVRDAAGNLYGTTQVGGIASFGRPSGTIFKVDPAGKETILYTFSGNPMAGDGSQPMGGLIMDSAGKLYGTTAAGGGPTAPVPFSRWIRRATIPICTSSATTWDQLSRRKRV